MLNVLFEALMALACAVVSAAVPILIPRALTLIAANIHQRDVALIAGAAARAGGRILVNVAGQMATPGYDLRAAVAAATAAEVATLKGQLPETIMKLGTTDGTLAAMIEGEVGKLLAAPGPVAGGASR